MYRVNPIDENEEEQFEYYDSSSDNRSYDFPDVDGMLKRNETISDEALLFITSPLSTIFMPALYTLVCLVSLPLNAVALVMFARQVRPVKPAGVFMLNLACTDLLFALLLPFRIHYYVNGSHWVFGPVLCRVVTASFYCNMHCSVLLIACISVDRLLAVVYPIQSLQWRRPRYAVVACVTAWILALVGSMPLALMEQTVQVHPLGITTCHDVQEFTPLIFYNAVFSCVVACLLFLLPALVTLVCYARVIWTLRSLSDAVGRHSRRKARAMYMVLTVLVLFLVCFAPTNCLLLLHYQHFTKEGVKDHADMSYVAYLVCLCVGSLNCCLDPLVYYFGSSQCQRELLAMLGCCKGLGSRRMSLFSSSKSSLRTTSGSVDTSSSKRKEPPVDKLDSLQPRT
ncbi:unnamed protein product [Merluccius merluccius]